MFEIAVVCTPRVVTPAPVPLARSSEIDAGAVLRFVVVDNDIAFVVVGLTDQPAKGAAEVNGVGYTRVGVLAVER